MSETIIAAKPDQRIWLLSGEPLNEFNLVDVIAWIVTPRDPPIPVTPFGPLDKNTEYVLGTDTGWIVLPKGPIFRGSNDVANYLRSRRAA
jgi:hypothetical protein